MPSVPISATAGSFTSEILEEGSIIDMSNRLINFSEPEWFHILSAPTCVFSKPVKLHKVPSGSFQEHQESKSNPERFV